MAWGKSPGVGGKPWGICPARPGCRPCCPGLVVDAFRLPAEKINADNGLRFTP